MDYLNGTSPDEVNHLYIQRNIPVIIKDAMFEWPVMKDSFTILNLTEVSKIFINDHIFVHVNICLF